MNPSRFFRQAAVIGCAVLLMAGCTDRKQLKEDWVQAAAKQEQIQSYQFSGEAEFQLDASLFKDAQPLTAAMLSAFRTGKLTYQGKASSKEPLVQAEADFKLVPQGSDKGIEMPVLLKDNKMYVHLPIINKTDEYVMLPLEQQAERLKQTGRLSSAASARLLQELEPDWLEPGAKDEKLPGGEAAKRITLQLTDKNQKQVSAYLLKALPTALDEWMTSGLLGEAQTKNWKDRLASAHMLAPSTFVIWIDEAGYIRQQQGELRFSLQEGGPVHTVRWTHRIDGINQPPSFTKEIPQLTKPLGDILKLLPKPAAAK
ncbi:hypothetical protein SAMN02799630_01329 [Paenibacillus sp. UNCCL117]|uniref:hypothetical protein n=1 Tax=unclassified Paenibacillus TaxID=185978 RepID=UPI00087E3153|nr:MULTISPECIES: hypothetical protein [unclassified Paenibacillus]SDC73396.1 hypothetical protein SAMN04488602_103307 [Paenibacillus sp. cl123]SFW25008.1 hypothetical protein SAMN02799630_01329 [Paenibacillus sp. UNCCL117]